MRLISDAKGIMMSINRVLRSRRGSQMVEAGIVLPVLILTVMLLLRTFVFYLQILDKGIDEHMEALDAWDRSSGTGLRTYTSTTEVDLLRGGLLRRSVSKRIDTRAYLLNEDLMVRASEVFGND